MNVTVEFSGGAELLFGGVKQHKLTLPDRGDKAWTLESLLPWIRDNLLKERPELFMQVITDDIVSVCNDWRLSFSAKIVRLV